MENYFNDLNHRSIKFDSVNTGHMISDKEHVIVSMNSSYREIMELKDDYPRHTIELYCQLNAHTLQMVTNPHFDYKQNLTFQNILISEIHELISNDATPVQFIYFVSTTTGFKSLTVHLIPIVNSSQELIGIEHIISGFDMWGVDDASDLLTKPGNYNLDQFVVLANSEDEYSKNLSPRQQEILYLLLQKIKLRQIGQILNLSYGYISKIVRETLLPKFGITNGGSAELYRVAKQLGYSKFVPQSLCNPSIMVLNKPIRDKIMLKLVEKYTKSKWP